MSTSNYPIQPNTSLFPSVSVKVCPCCGRDIFKLFKEHKHLQVLLSYQICCHCSLVFMSPRFDETDMENFYSEMYRVLYSGDAKPTPTSIEQQRLRAENLAQLIRINVKEEIASHLDIGSSTGLLLQSVKSLFPQIRSIGIEPSHAYRLWCQEQGIEVYPSLEDLKSHTDSLKFQLVTASHVLEHLPNPVAYLEVIHSQFLAPNGVLLIEVPNLFGHRSFEIAHLLCFSPKTLFDTLAVAGFQITSYYAHSIPKDYRPGKMYLTVVAKPVNVSKIQVQSVWWPFVKLRRELFVLRSYTRITLIKLPRKLKRRALLLFRTLGLTHSTANAPDSTGKT